MHSNINKTSRNRKRKSRINIIFRDIVKDQKCTNGPLIGGEFSLPDERGNAQRRLLVAAGVFWKREMHRVYVQRMRICASGREIASHMYRMTVSAIVSR